MKISDPDFMPPSKSGNWPSQAGDFMPVKKGQKGPKGLAPSRPAERRKSRFRFFRFLASAKATILLSATLFSKRGWGDCGLWTLHTGCCAQASRARNGKNQVSGVEPSSFT